MNDSPNSCAHKILYFWAVKKVLLLAVLFLSLSIYGQENSNDYTVKIDSIKAELETMPLDSNYVQSLVDWYFLIPGDDVSQMTQVLDSAVSCCEIKLNEDLTEKEYNYFSMMQFNLLNELAMNYSMFNNELAVETALKALKAAEESNNNEDIAIALNNLGLELRVNKEFEAAISYFNMVNSMEGDEILYIKAHSNSNIGDVFAIELNDYPQAVEHHKKALQILDSLPAEFSHREALGLYSDFAKCLIQFDRLDSAASYLDKIDSILIISEKNYGYEALYHGHWTKIYEKQSNHKKQKTHALQFLNAAIELNLYIQMEEAHRALYNIYKLEQVWDSALVHLELQGVYKDTLIQLNKQEHAFKAQILYEYDKKHYSDSIANVNKISHEREVNEQKIQVEQGKTIIAYIIISGVAVLLLLVLLIYRQTKSKNKNLRLNQKLMEQSIKDKEMFLKEIHHRVKNNMQMASSLLQLKSISISNKDAKEALQQSKSELMTLSIAHEKMYKNNEYQKIELIEYLEDILKTLLSSFLSNSSNKLDFSGPKTTLTIEQAQAIGFILHELITNSIKHAWELPNNREVSLHIIKENEQLVLSYKDNGKGLPADYSNRKSIGLNLVNAFTQRQLKGSIKFPESKTEPVTIRFIPK